VKPLRDNGPRRSDTRARAYNVIISYRVAQHVFPLSHLTETGKPARG